MQEQFNTHTITCREMGVLLIAGNFLISLTSYPLHYPPFAYRILFYRNIFFSFPILLSDYITGEPGKVIREKQNE